MGVGRWVCVHVQLPNCAHTVGHMGVEGERGAGWSWFQVRMAKAVVFGYGPRLTHKTHSTHTHTQAKSLCDHSNEAESAEHLAKPQQHFTIASLQLCVCVRV